MTAKFSSTWSNTFMAARTALVRAATRSLYARTASTGAPSDVAIPSTSSLPATTSAADATALTAPRRRRRAIELLSDRGTTYVGPPDPLSNLRPILPPRPAYASPKTSLYAPTLDDAAAGHLVTHPYEITEVGPAEYTLDHGLEAARQDLEAKELHWRLWAHRQDTLAHDFWSAINARYRAERAAAEADGIGEADFLRRWCDENRGVYRAYDKEWIYLLKRSLKLAYRAWKRDQAWQRELLKAKIRLWRDENLPAWLARL
jgi:hypothetical protein